VFRARAASGPKLLVDAEIPKAALQDGTAAMVSLAAQAGAF
jgi:hypothetical protein